MGLRSAGPFDTARLARSRPSLKPLQRFLEVSVRQRVLATSELTIVHCLQRVEPINQYLNHLFVGRAVTPMFTDRAILEVQLEPECLEVVKCRRVLARSLSVHFSFPCTRAV